MGHLRYHHPRRISVAVSLVILIALSLGLLPRLLVRDAYGSCTLGQFAIVSGNESTDFHVKGAKMDIWVNNFGAQCQSWRGAAVAKNNCNLAEVGWINKEQYGNDNIPFRTIAYQPNCAVSTLYHPNMPLSEDVMHEFKVHDNNGDSYWSFAVDGNALGDRFNNSFINGWALGTSERDNNGDSLWAKFRNMQMCTNAGSCWFDFGNLARNNDNATDYTFCWLSTKSFDVKQAC